MGNLIITSDGSHTIYIPELDEHYHSVHGAIGESKHIFINAGLNYCTNKSINIFEAGFGTGLNALLTALEIIGSDRKVNYTSIEKYPIDKETVKSLNHGSILGNEEIFANLHSSPWNTSVVITENFSLFKINGDLTTFCPTGTYDLIYFDAFGPDKQPGMWTMDVFTKISGITDSGGILVTYSAKGQVKRNLRACGFDVSLLPGPPGKRQIIRAIKK